MWSQPVIAVGSESPAEGPRPHRAFCRQCCRRLCLRDNAGTPTVQTSREFSSQASSGEFSLLMENLENHRGVFVLGMGAGGTRSISPVAWQRGCSSLKWVLWV